MSVINTIKFIINHPLNQGNKLGAMARYINWQVSSRIRNDSISYPFASRSKLLIRKGMTGATGNIYGGLHEFEDMSFVLHFLRPEDTFVDIGANIGSYTVLASSEVGAKTISFEPIPSTFASLKDNIALNKIDNNVIAYNIGLGSERGSLFFTNTLDTVNHVIPDRRENSLKVEVRRLDDMQLSDTPILIKMDVEGFEKDVLLGMQTTLTNADLQAIIVELNGSGGRYGVSDDEVHEMLVTHDFAPFQYLPFLRKLKPLKTYGDHNTIYIRDIVSAQNRVSDAPTFIILGHAI